MMLGNFFEQIQQIDRAQRAYERGDRHERGDGRAPIETGDDLGAASRIEMDLKE